MAAEVVTPYIYLGSTDTSSGSTMELIPRVSLKVPSPNIGGKKRPNSASSSVQMKSKESKLKNKPTLGDIDGEEHSEVESAAELLYGLIHACYIITRRGLNAMHEKYKKGDFGRCPRVFCGRQPCLPVGQADIPHNGSVKICCPKCEEVCFPRCKYQSNMDGAYVGTTFPHLYLTTYPSAKPANAV